MLGFNELFDLCTDKAKEISSGHFTLARFTTNWRAGFFTPSDTLHWYHLAEGKTAEDAMAAALEEHPLYYDGLDEKLLKWFHGNIDSENPIADIPFRDWVKEVKGLVL